MISKATSIIQQRRERVKEDGETEGQAHIVVRESKKREKPLDKSHNARKRSTVQRG